MNDAASVAGAHSVGLATFRYSGTVPARGTQLGARFDPSGQAVAGYQRPLGCPSGCDKRNDLRRSPATTVPGETPVRRTEMTTSSVGATIAPGGQVMLGSRGLVRLAVPHRNRCFSHVQPTRAETWLQAYTVW